MNMQMPSMPISYTQPSGITAEAVNAGGARSMPRNMVEFNARGGTGNAMKRVVGEVQAIRAQKAQRQIFEQLLAAKENGARMFIQDAAKIYGPEVTQYFPPTDLYIDSKTGQTDYLEWYKRATVGIAEFSKDRDAKKKEAAEAEKQATIQGGRAILQQPLPPGTNREGAIRAFTQAGAVGAAPIDEVKFAAEGYQTIQNQQQPFDRARERAEDEDKEIIRSEKMVQDEENNLTSLRTHIKSLEAQLKDLMNPNREQLQQELQQAKDDEKATRKRKAGMQAYLDNAKKTGTGKLAVNMRNVDAQREMENRQMAPEVAAKTVQSLGYGPDMIVFKMLTQPGTAESLETAIRTTAAASGQEDSAKYAFQFFVELSKAIGEALKGAGISHPTHAMIRDIIAEQFPNMAQQGEAVAAPPVTRQLSAQELEEKRRAFGRVGDTITGSENYSGNPMPR